MPYSLVLERASGTHNYSVQRKVEPTHLRVLCSVPVSQAHSNKFRLAALEALCFISLWCLGAQRKGMVIIMERSHPFGHIAATMEVSGMRIQIYVGADKATLLAILQATKSC